MILCFILERLFILRNPAHCTPFAEVRKGSAGSGSAAKPDLQLNLPQLSYDLLFLILLHFYSAFYSALKCKGLLYPLFPLTQRKFTGHIQKTRSWSSGLRPTVTLGKSLNLSEFQFLLQIQLCQPKLPHGIVAGMP